MNSVKKQHYIDNLIEEDNVLTEFLKNTNTHIENTQDDLTEM